MTIRYKRVPVRQPRYMVLHAFDINCLTTNPPSCMTRYEWVDREELDKKNIAVVGKSKLNKTHGDYCAIKY